MNIQVSIWRRECEVFDDTRCVDIIDRNHPYDDTLYSDRYELVPDWDSPTLRAHGGPIYAHTREQAIAAAIALIEAAR